MISNFNECYENKDPYIHIYKNALSSEICKEIIKMFEENNDKHCDGIIIAGKNPKIKITKEMYFNEEPLNVYDNILFENLHNYLENYVEIFNENKHLNIKNYMLHMIQVIIYKNIK